MDNFYCSWNYNVHYRVRNNLVDTSRRICCLVYKSTTNIHEFFSIFSPVLLQLIPPLSSSDKLVQIGWFFTKAGAFVFGSGLAIVPFLYSGVVKEYQWLTEQQFVDVVAVAMITPGPVVITVGFIGYLVAGVPGACVVALAIFALLCIYGRTRTLF